MHKVFRLYLILSGLLVNMVLAAMIFSFAWIIYDLRVPVPVLAERAVNRIDESSPSLSSSLDAVLKKMGIIDANDFLYGKLLQSAPDSAGWNGWGARVSRVLSTQRYDVIGRPQVEDPLVSNAGAGEGHYPVHAGISKTVGSVEELREAVSQAEPGDRIMIAPGDYRISQNIDINKAGTLSQPVILGAGRLGDVRLLVETTQAFLVQKPYWVFENLDMRGVCADHSTCEHAFHIVGNGGSTVIRNNRLLDFNSMIKVNGQLVGGKQAFPNYGLVESNSIYNTTTRNTGNPVSLIDIVGANGWHIRNNLIFDFGKAGGDRTSYGAFAKGNAAGTMFESNMIACQLMVPMQKGVRVGLSLGGGGTDAASCRDGKCLVEHSRGILRNNIVMHCPNDVGIYLNKSEETDVYNNTLYNTLGIDVRFPASTAAIYNNILTGRIHDRDDALSVRGSNIITGFTRNLAQDEFHSWFLKPEMGDFTLLDGAGFVDKGVPKEQLRHDFCGNRRVAGSNLDIGAIEYADQKVCRPLGEIASSVN